MAASRELGGTPRFDGAPGRPAARASQGSETHRGPAVPFPEADLAAAAKRLVTEARAGGRSALSEVEGRELLELMGIPVAAAETVRDGAIEGVLAALSRLEARVGPLGGSAVVKVVSAALPHKSDAGGVCLLRGDENGLAASAAEAIAAMERRFSGLHPEGYLIAERVPYDGEFGRELILGFRTTADFGPVVSVAAGGVRAEFLARGIGGDGSAALLSPALAGTPQGAEAAVNGKGAQQAEGPRTAAAPFDTAYAARALSGLLVARAATEGLRGQKPFIDGAFLADAVARMVSAAPILVSAGIAEFEANPVVVSPSDAGGRLVALDALARLGASGAGADAANAEGSSCWPRESAAGPTEKLWNILKPRSIVVAGVSSTKVNKGRIILRNILASGTPAERVFVLKEGDSSIDGCACVAELSDLPSPTDLLVLAVPAAAVPGLVAQAARLGTIEGIIVIPGGFEEKSGGQTLASPLRAAIAESRSRAGRGPVLNGGNCLGVRSVPGRYSTLFVPDHKMPMSDAPAAPLALICQSGAFAISRLSRMGSVNPRYVITVGNQTDLTVGDYLERLADDASLRVFGVYVEGFKGGDGVRFLRAARRIRDSGRVVVLYRAGRTAAGAAASASHTASIAGDYAVARSLCAEAGVVLADGFQDFDELVKLFTLLDGRPLGGNRLAAVSSAGCECVAVADNLGSFSLATFGRETVGVLASLCARLGVDSIVDLHNPVDLTPMADDEAYAEGASAAFRDPGVDAGIVAIIPLATTVNSLPRDPARHGEDLEAMGALPARLGGLMKETRIPWVASVDAGSLYDPFAEAIEAEGVPVFRTVSRAMVALHAYAKRWLPSA